MEAEKIRGMSTEVEAGKKPLEETKKDPREDVILETKKKSGFKGRVSDCFKSC